MRKLLIAAGCMLLQATPVAAQERPPAAYDNWGVCPFECCTYREWTADAEAPVYQGRDTASPVLFRLRRDEDVRALTGVVVTEKAAVIRIDRPLRDGYVKGSDQPQLSLQAGDKVYLLSPLGEGSYLFWYQGKVYQSGNQLAALPGVDGQRAKMRWWKLVENKAGQRGWTISDRFRNVDACG